MADLLSSILHFKARARNPRARRRRAPSSSVHAVDLLQVPRGARLRNELQPRHAPIPQIRLPEGCARGCGDRVVLRAGRLAKGHGGRVEVEERRSETREVVVA